MPYKNQFADNWSVIKKNPHWSLLTLLFAFIIGNIVAFINKATSFLFIRTTPVSVLVLPFNAPALLFTCPGFTNTYNL